MEIKSIYENLTPIFQEALDDYGVVPHGDMVADDVPSWDSLSHVRLIIAIEDAFSLRFTAEEATSTNNVGELVAIIARKSG